MSLLALRDRLRAIRARPAVATTTRVLVATVIALVVFWILARRLTWSPTSIDEATFLWAGWSVRRGLVPFRDFHDFKPHMIFFSNALALEIFGLAHQRYRLFFALLAGSSVVAMVVALCTRKVPVGITTAFVFILCWLWLDPGFHDSSFDDAESIGISFYFLGVACLFVGRGGHASRRFRWANLAGGVLLSLAVLSKEPFALCVIPTWLCLAAWNHADEPSLLTLKRFARWSLTGVGGVLVLLLGYMVFTRSLRPYIEAARLYLPFARTICVTYGVWTPSTFKAEWLVRFTKLSDNLVNFAHLGIAVPFLVAPFVIVPRRLALVTAMATLVVLGGLYAVTLGGCFFQHYYMLGMTGLLFLMSVGAQYLASESSGRARRYLTILLPLLAGWALWPRVSAELDAHHDPGGPTESPALIEYVKSHTTRTDTIFSTGWQGIYPYTNRPPAVGESSYFDAFLTLYPGTTDEERVKPLYAQLVANRPKIIIIERYLAEKRSRTMAALVTPFVHNFGYVEHHEPGVAETMYLRPD